MNGAGRKGTCPVPVEHGEWASLPPTVKGWARAKIDLCRPDKLHIMDGSVFEDKALKDELVSLGRLIKLDKYDNCYLARTDPKDVARVESKTVIATPERLESVPPTADGVKGTLGNWMSPQDLDQRVQELFPGCMEG